MSAEDCTLCFWNSDTGYFEPCCQEHEQAYVEYLQERRESNESTAADGSEVPR